MYKSYITSLDHASNWHNFAYLKLLFCNKSSLLLQNIDVINV